jgi:ubiquinone/menaquinone biosynthesis C-methylase UbiE
MHKDMARTRKDSGMEGWVARWYARTRHNDMQDFRREADKVAARLSPGAEVLEVAPGPGYFSIELAKRGRFHVSGLDISHTFVEMARAAAEEAAVKVDFRQGNAADLPFADGSFDFVYCSAAFKNFADPVGAINEMYRVLRPGGAALIVDLRRDVPVAEVDEYVRRSGRGAVDAWITRTVFRYALIGRAYTADEFRHMAMTSRFGDCEIEADSIGLGITFRKPRPV